MHREDRVAQLRYFLIDPAYRGIGLGGRLMESSLLFLRQQGYGFAYLWTTDEQESAISLYEKYGFSLAEEKISTRLGKPVCEQRFELRLRG
jgi:peptidyl-dipeptidase Dcp